ncbi:MAG TPA: BrnT family toxin [Solidesulfovibrio magneticus]|nr:BrnT family toxin [Solidesulfovibrio magneticus]
MDFEWDEAKRLANLAKHGIDFLDAKAAIENSPVFF